MAATEDLNRLTTFQHHVEDMRNLVMCKICLKPLYEPYILACGHTYCYGCLRSWFCGQPNENRRRKKNCPDCRAEVKLTPSPNYILRDLVHMFISRTELLPEDETVDEHVAGKMAEAALLAGDKDGKGIFQGVFRVPHHPFSAFSGPLQDVADGVLRCPECYWELEDGRCEQCGYELDDSSYLDFSDEGGSDLGDDQSIPSDLSSLDTDSYASRQNIPHHLFRSPSLAGDVDPSIATSDLYSDRDDSSVLPFGRISEDGDEMREFIDDNEEDEPDEVDEDDMVPAQYGYPLVPRRYHYRIPDSDEDQEEYHEEEHDSSPDEDENDEEEGDVVTNHGHRFTGWAETVDESDSEGESDEIEEENENQDQQATYDDSEEEESRSSTPVARTFPRRRAIVISDDEDDDEDEHGHGHEDVQVEPTDTESNSENHSHTEAVEKDESDDSDSDDTTTTPQPSSSRRQRLDNHRKRRRAPNPWRALVRGSNQDTSNDRRERQSAASWFHDGRAGRRTNVDVLVGPSLSP